MVSRPCAGTIVGVVPENKLEDYLYHTIIHSVHDTPSFLLVLPADRYSTEFCVARVLGMYDPAVVEGLSRTISNTPFLPNDSSAWITLEERRMGLQFFEGHEMIMPNVYAVHYGS